MNAEYIDSLVVEYQTASRRAATYPVGSVEARKWTKAAGWVGDKLWAMGIDPKAVDMGLDLP